MESKEVNELADFTGTEDEKKLASIILKSGIFAESNFYQTKVEELAKFLIKDGWLKPASNPDLEKKINDYGEAVANFALYGDLKNIITQETTSDAVKRTKQELLSLLSQPQKGKTQKERQIKHYGLPADAFQRRM